ncbi:MAG: hypothetical protein QM756_03810 [Polyangiaceae bacterium]
MSSWAFGALGTLSRNFENHVAQVPLQANAREVTLDVPLVARRRRDQVFTKGPCQSLHTTPEALAVPKRAPKLAAFVLGERADLPRSRVVCIWFAGVEVRLQHEPVGVASAVGWDQAQAREVNAELGPFEHARPEVPQITNQGRDVVHPRDDRERLLAHPAYA